MKTLLTQSVITTLLLCLVSITWAGNVTIPNTFSSGTKAVAAEVNANFGAVETEVNDNDSRITDLENPVSSVVAIHPAAFQSSSCNSVLSFSSLHFSSGTNCGAYANVSIPHNATITATTCYFLDNSTQHAIISWFLISHPNTSISVGSFIANVDNVTSAIFNSLTAVTSAVTGLNYVVNNNAESLVLHVFLNSTSALDTNAKILGCKVNYTL